VLVTQQPGSIPQQLLSQGDNFFVFHLLSAGDLQALKYANAHFSDDLLSSLLNEPLPGHGVFWSSASAEGAAKAYPIPVRILSFEQKHAPRDLACSSQAIDNYASQLRRRYERAIRAAVAHAPTVDISEADAEVTSEPGTPDPTEVGAKRTLDPSAAIRRAAIQALAINADMLHRAGSGDGIPWMEVQRFLESTLPPEVVGSLVPDPNDWAFRLVAPALTEIFGLDGWRRDKQPSKRDPSRLVTYVRATSPHPAAATQASDQDRLREPGLFDQEPP
jgi:uncharacterized protein